MGASQKTADRIEQADELSMSTTARTCEECQEVCFEVLVWAHGDIGGRSYRNCLFVRDHLPIAALLTAVGRWMIAHGSILSDRDNARWILEHQTKLW